RTVASALGRQVQRLALGGMFAPSRSVDRLAVAVVFAATLAWLALTLLAHRTPLYGVETDLLGDSFPATRALLSGHLEADRFQFRGPGYPLLLAGASRVAGGDAFLGARLLNVVAAGAAALAAFLLIRSVLGGLV